MEVLLGLFLAVAALALIFGGPQAAGKVLASPFSFFGWALRGTLGATGRGIGRVISDAHRYFYRRWPGRTIAVYAGLLGLLMLLGLLSGCGATLATETTGRGFYTEGQITSPEQYVPPREVVTGGLSVTVGGGGIFSGGTGSVRGPRVENGKIDVLHREPFGGPPPKRRK